MRGIWHEAATNQCLCEVEVSDAGVVVVVEEDVVGVKHPVDESHLMQRPQPLEHPHQHPVDLLQQHPQSEHPQPLQHPHQHPVDLLEQHPQSEHNHQL